MMRNMRYSNVPVKEQLYIERSKVSEKKKWQPYAYNLKSSILMFWYVLHISGISSVLRFIKKYKNIQRYRCWQVVKDQNGDSKLYMWSK